MTLFIIFIWLKTACAILGEDVIKLAEAFYLSGSQIENITRKRTIKQK
jgi:hypothetical protein